MSELTNASLSHIKSAKIRFWFVIIAVLIGFPLLFVGGPDYYSGRLVKTLWGLGHIPFMFMFGLALIEFISRLKLKSLWAPLLIYCVVILGVSFVTEFLQGFVGRSPSMSDVSADIFGALTALVIASRYQFISIVPGNRVLTMVTLVVGVIVFMTPLTIMYDEALAKYQFPLISGFENKTELTRWASKETLIRSTDRATEGRYSLKFAILPEGYSGLSIMGFPANWKPYRWLQFDIWSASSPLPITVRIHDRNHVVGAQLYSDRFNQRYILLKGWNRILIDLQKVKIAPQGRMLNLEEVWGLGIFSHDLGAREVVYLDRVALKAEIDK